MNHRNLLRFLIVLIPFVWMASYARAEGWLELKTQYSGAGYCGECHGKIVEEWRDSMHAHSTLDQDPLYRAMTAKAVQAMGEPAAVKCRRCHYPPQEEQLAQLGGLVEGINCVVCHRVHVDHPETALPSGKTAELRGAYAPDKVDDPQALCLSCHKEMKSPQGYAVCTTGAENEGASAGLCIDCHMPKENQGGAVVRSHRFPGGHTREFLRGKAQLALKVEGSGEKRELVVEVQRKEVGHDLPTGTPMRAVVLRVEMHNAAGEAIWQNITGNPYVDDPQAVFARTFADAEGRKPVPPFRAAGPSEDTRLKPGQTRTLRYPVPEGTASVQVRLLYQLAPPPMLEAAGVAEEYRRPVPLAESTLSFSQ